MITSPTQISSVVRLVEWIIINLSPVLFVAYVVPGSGDGDSDVVLTMVVEVDEIA